MLISDLHKLFELLLWPLEHIEAWTKYNVFKCIFLNENIWILSKISLEYIMVLYNRMINICLVFSSEYSQSTSHILNQFWKDLDAISISLNVLRMHFIEGELLKN